MEHAAAYLLLFYFGILGALREVTQRPLVHRPTH